MSSGRPSRRRYRRLRSSSNAVAVIVEPDAPEHVAALAEEREHRRRFREVQEQPILGHEVREREAAAGLAREELIERQRRRPRRPSASRSARTPAADRGGALPRERINSICSVSRTAARPPSTSKALADRSIAAPNRIICGSSLESPAAPSPYSVLVRSIHACRIGECVCSASGYHVERPRGGPLAEHGGIGRAAVQRPAHVACRRRCTVSQRDGDGRRRAIAPERHEPVSEASLGWPCGATRALHGPDRELVLLDERAIDRDARDLAVREEHPVLPVVRERPELEEDRRPSGAERALRLNSRAGMRNV